MSSINLKELTKSLNEISATISRLEFLNQEIQKQVCKSTIDKITDASLLSIYKEQKSVIKQINLLKGVLLKEDIETIKIDSILNNFVLSLVPAGTKGVIRGNIFNQIVKNKILSYDFLTDDYIVKFEEKHPDFETSEIPDWYIYHKKQKKIIIGMNQLDLWSGGQQINRGSKYVIDAKEIPNYKLVSVVCNDIKIKANKSKTYTLFDIGFEKKNLCFLNGLKEIVELYFESE